jgi:hypothetical protein
MNRDEAIRYFGSQEAYSKENDEVLALLGVLTEATNGYSIQAVLNAALLLGLAALRASNGSIHDALNFVHEGWRNKLVRDLGEAMRPVTDDRERGN